MSWTFLVVQFLYRDNPRPSPLCWVASRKVGGDKRLNTWVSTGVAHVNLFNSINVLNNIYYVHARGVEEFPRGMLSYEPLNRKARWFKSGNIADLQADD